MDKPSRTGRRRVTHRQRPLLFATAVAGFGIAATACSSGAGVTSAYGGSADARRSGDSVAITTHPTKLGIILTGPDGRSVYLFEKDLGTTSSCRAACAAVWPPVTSGSTPSVSGLAHRALLGTTRRDDGVVQITYAQHPLYYFSGDHAAGDVTGEGMHDFGAAWYVVAANGHNDDTEWLLMEGAR